MEEYHVLNRSDVSKERASQVAFWVANNPGGAVSWGYSDCHVRYVYSNSLKKHTFVITNGP